MNLDNDQFARDMWFDRSGKALAEYDPHLPSVIDLAFSPPVPAVGVAFDVSSDGKRLLVNHTEEEA